MTHSAVLSLNHLVLFIQYIKEKIRGVYLFITKPC